MTPMAETFLVYGPRTAYGRMMRRVFRSGRNSAKTNAPAAERYSELVNVTKHQGKNRRGKESRNMVA